MKEESKGAVRRKDAYELGEERCLGDCMKEE